MGPLLYGAWVVSVSLITFFVYGWDKGQATRNGRRVSETSLHVLALVGGFLGGWLGRWFFRHKTRKFSFLFVLLLSTALHGYLTWRWLGQH